MSRQRLPTHPLILTNLLTPLSSPSKHVLYYFLLSSLHSLRHPASSTMRYPKRSGSYIGVNLFLLLEVLKFYSFSLLTFFSFGFSPIVSLSVCIIVRSTLPYLATFILDYSTYVLIILSFLSFLLLFFLAFCFLPLDHFRVFGSITSMCIF